MADPTEDQKISCGSHVNPKDTKLQIMDEIVFQMVSKRFSFWGLRPCTMYCRVVVSVSKLLVSLVNIPAVLRL